METKVTPINLGIAKVFAIKGDRTVLVDAGTPNTGERIMAGLEANGIAPEDVSLILITHGHFDHISSINYLREQIAAPVAIGRDDAEALRSGTNPPANLSGFWGGLFKLLSPPDRKLPIQTFEPEITVEDELDLKPYEVDARVIATPGHTAGSLSVITAGGEAIVGDLLISNFMAFGAPTVAFWAWSKETSLKSIQRVLAVKPKLIHVTHGGPFSVETVTRRYPDAEPAAQRATGMKPGDRSCCAD